MDSLAALGINLSSLIAQLIAFLVLLSALYIVAYKPFMRMLDERSKKVKDSVEQAEEIKKKLESAENDAAKMIEEANIKSRQIAEQAAKTGDEIKHKAAQEAKIQAEAIISKAQKEIQLQKEVALSELRKEVADLAVLVAGKAINRSLDDKGHRQLIETVLDDAIAAKG
jgi:F-type H+-transporting ATPase subunit b